MRSTPPTKPSDKTKTAQRPFAVFDIDGTLIRRQLYHKLVDRLAKAGALGPEAPRMLEQALATWKRRELSSGDAFKHYDDILVQTYEDALGNISTELSDSIVVEVIEEYKDRAYHFTKRLLRDLKHKGYVLFIVSGSHTELIERIARYYGFDDWVGTHYERVEGKFTGKVQFSTLDKERSLKVLLRRNDVSSAGSVGIGDTASDIPMLKMVENPIAFNPDLKLFTTAQENGWKVVVERKNVIYELGPKDGQYVLTP